MILSLYQISKICMVSTSIKLEIRAVSKACTCPASVKEENVDRRNLPLAEQGFGLKNNTM